jgi:hypothetical protein
VGLIPKLSPIADPETLAALAEALEQRMNGGGRSGNGRTSEFVRLALVLVFSALLSYITTSSTMDKSIAEVRTTEDAHFQEILRHLQTMQADIRELRERR